MIKSLNFSWFIKLIIIYLFSISMVSANSINSIRTWPAPEETRVVLDLGAVADYSYFPLTKPNRLVLDLKNIKTKVKLPIKITDSKILRKIRLSSAKDKKSLRLVFELKKMVTPTIFTLPPTGNYGYRLVIDIPHTKKQVVPSYVTPHHGTTLPRGNAEIIIAIDPGHGGEDPGAIGPHRKREKNVTLAIAKKLAKKISATPGMRAVLTRSGDYYVSLNKRSEIARNKKALLLISIHADGFKSSRPKGASVWVLSNRRATTEIGRWLENHEKQSELLGGGAVLSKSDEDKYLSQTVLDLQFTHSQKEGTLVANKIIKELAKVTQLHKKKPESASLAVLKSPDIPSLLVETGFITNRIEERLLTSRKHQEKLANAVYKGVVQYFKVNPPPGTLFAAQKTTRVHVVKSGDSISLLARRYATSVSLIKKVNKLRSNVLRKGQRLIIPLQVKTAAVVESKTQTKTKVQTKIITHKVKKGEYLNLIAKRYKMSLSELKKLNKLRKSTLHIGQKLKVKIQIKVKAKPKCSLYKSYVIKKGDNLSKIAQRYHLTIQKLVKLNKLKTTIVHVGQKLRVLNNRCR